MLPFLVLACFAASSLAAGGLFEYPVAHLISGAGKYASMFRAPYQPAASSAVTTLQRAANGSLPTLKLPYGTWRASSYDAANDVYVFRNIRFAAPPVGKLRFARPAEPEMTDTLQDGSYGPSCKGAGLAALAAAGAGITGQSSSSLTGALSGLNASSIPSSSPLAGLLGLNAAEDCLFLDLYVPSNALSGHAKLPVINWIYGGAYIGGSKDGLYAGTPLVKQSGGNVIFVAGNYRLAAFGFLCGSTPEREKATSVAFWDQRAVLEWIQKYIHLVGGDAHEVSAWGESAGAGSIEHQLVQFGGRQDPLFSKAVIQSPAFEQLYDRRGALQDTYEQLERLAGCAGEGLDCLRSVSTDAINNASNAIINAAPPGTFGFGPCADGSFIRQLPALEFASGNYWKGIKSLVLSHVADEAEIFVAPNITTNAEVTSYLTSIYSTAPNTIINAVLQQYPPAGNGSKYTTVFNRVKGFIQDSSFVCNVRSLTDAYRGRTYNVQYSRGSGLHGTDISADFYDPTNALSTLLAFRDQNISQFAPSYQSYLVSHARTGDPNTYRNTSGQFPTIEWPKVTDQRNANYLSNVLYAGDAGYSLFSDNETSRDACGFWTNIGAAVTGLGGYAPPGAVISTDIEGVQYNRYSASKNYRTPRGDGYN